MDGASITGARLLQIPAAKIVFTEEDRKEILALVEQSLTTGALTLGPHGKAFEAEFARRVGLRHAIAVNSGTSSIEIPMRHYNVTGRKVIVPTNTFFATPAGVVHAGGRVEFAEANDRLQIDVDDVNERIDDRTAGVVAVHIGGLVDPSVKALQEICKDRGIVLFEDAAHAHGSSLGGVNAGQFGHSASFSFYPTKVMTSGEGGMIVTNDDALDQDARVYRDQGKAGFLGNIHTRMGYNWRMSEVHAAIGLVHLKRLDQFIKDRQRIAAFYDKHLRGTKGLRVIETPAGSVNNYYKYMAVLDRGLDRKALKAKCKEKGVSLSGEVYELPCHLQPVFKEMLGTKEGSYPVAEDLCARHVCLPLFPGMTEEQARFVVDTVKEALP